MDIIHRLLQQVGAMTHAQREVLNLYVDWWGKSLMDLKSHLRMAGGQGE